MQQVMENLVNEAGKRTRQEVDAVRKQCNKNIAKLMDEIQALENVRLEEGWTYKNAYS